MLNLLLIVLDCVGQQSDSTHTKTHNGNEKMNTFQLIKLEGALKAMAEAKAELNRIGTDLRDPVCQGAQHWVGRLEALEREMQAVLNYHAQS